MSLPEDDDLVRFTIPVSAEQAEDIQSAIEEGRPVRLTAKLTLPDDMANTLSSIMNAPEDMDMVQLLEMAGLDPSKDLRHSNFAGTSWGAHDLTGYDFTGADLAGCDFSEANVDGAIFDGARLDDVTWPEGFDPEAPSILRH